MPHTVRPTVRSLSTPAGPWPRRAPRRPGEPPGLTAPGKGPAESKGRWGVGRRGQSVRGPWRPWGPGRGEAPRHGCGSPSPRDRRSKGRWAERTAGGSTDRQRSGPTLYAGPARSLVCVPPAAGARAQPSFIHRRWLGRRLRFSFHVEPGSSRAHDMTPPSFRRLAAPYPFHVERSSRANSHHVPRGTGGTRGTPRERNLSNVGTRPGR
jgi:hypothetical protein